MQLDLGEPVDLAGGSLWDSLLDSLRRNLLDSLGVSPWGSLRTSLLEDRR